MKIKVGKIFVSVLVLTLGLFSGSLVSRGASAPKEPTVDDCVERMGLSEEKCTEMIEKFKNMTPEERAKMRPQGSPEGGSGRPPGVSGEGEIGRPPMKEGAGLGDTSNIDAQIEKAKNARSAREERFSQMEEKMEKIVEYLKSHDVGTTEAENNISTFREKAADVLGAYETYIAALEDSRDDNSGKITDAAREAREKIRELSDDLKDFFRDTLLAKLRDQINQLAE
ncbi:MAG: hypothetical protein WC726_00315 [Parcubacteria group bacterium]|jgi:hypothetical protein